MSKIIFDDLNSMINKGYSIDVINKLIDNVFRLSILVKDDYPNYRDWFYSKQVPGIYDGSRNMIIAHFNDQILGFVCLKRDIDEKKICTFYVVPSFRKNMIGDTLTKLSMNWLECDKPLITIPSDKLLPFLKIGHKYGWQVTDIKEGLYRNNGSEIIVNDFKSESDLSLNKNKVKTLTNIYFIVKFNKLKGIFNLFLKKKEEVYK